MLAFKRLNSPIWLIDGPYQVLQLQVRVDLGVMGMNGYSTFSRTKFLPSASYPGHSLKRGITLLQRYGQCILQPQPTRFISLTGLALKAARQLKGFKETWNMNSVKSKQKEKDSSQNIRHKKKLLDFSNKVLKKEKRKKKP